MEPDADEPVGNDKILDPSVRSERGPQAFRVDPRHEEVGVLRLEPEQLVANGPADEVGIEPKQAHVILDLFHGRRKRYAFPPDQKELRQRESAVSRWLRAEGT